eukprot:CAMPEP_0194521458 /NCGR_PEP_ID=MMETSP0253-20130528/55772_1 /TAXON_ID=2966 /ORGANISM="Noctiluca scintillans" /LENGTH=172 /DNA_ID=CAMNT_0039365817 /DNA_START=74 /DNA_END=594 /DNA_ORIENTATION=+
MALQAVFLYASCRTTDNMVISADGGVCVAQAPHSKVLRGLTPSFRLGWNNSERMTQIMLDTFSVPSTNVAIQTGWSLDTSDTQRRASFGGGWSWITIAAAYSNVRSAHKVQSIQVFPASHHSFHCCPFGRVIDSERGNIVAYYDMPDDSDWHLHRVGRTDARIHASAFAQCT